MPHDLFWAVARTVEQTRGRVASVMAGGRQRLVSDASRMALGASDAQEAWSLS